LGYILKDTDRAEFIKIIQQTHAGKIPSSPYLAHLALEHAARLGRPLLVLCEDIGPEALSEVPSVSGADLLVPELDSIEANLFGVLARLLPEKRVLITASDNPLLTTEAFDNFLARCPEHSAVAYPILRHETFIRQFPRATNVSIKLRDGTWIGGGQAVIHSKSIPKLQHWIQTVLAARKDLKQMVSLLGLKFAMQFSLKRVTSQQVEDRICEITGLPIRFIRDCSSVFPIDIDDPADWDYLNRWTPAKW